MAHVTFPKPLKGEHLLERRARRADLKHHERTEMQAALRRDGHVCRWPGCRYGRKDIPVDPSHLTSHRGMGGNPDGTRTNRRDVLALCRIHHGMLHACRIEITPMDVALGTDGPLMFFQQSESGRMECVAVEKSIGVSETRGL